MNEQMQKQFHKRQYPLVRYLGLLLAVALLFTGVTFARYATNSGIAASVGIAAFDATYSIDRVNSTTFGNQDYWINVGGTDVDQGAGTAITVGVTLKNNGDTAVRPTLHLEAPAEYWNNIALQLTDSRDVAAENILTPQLVIKDIMAATGDSFDTSNSKDYGSLGGDAVLTLSKNGDSRTATWEDANGITNKMTISKRTETTVQYSVGFARKNEDTAEIFPPIFVDCQKEMTIYSIDIELPALALEAAEKSTDGGKTATEKRVVVWLTWTNALPNTSVSADEAFWNELESAAEQFPIDNMIIQDDKKTDTGEDITILGYHFDTSGVPVVQQNDAEKWEETGETTTVRVKKTFASADGATPGSIEYFHVASLNDEDGSYVHPLKEVGENIYACDNASGAVRVDLTGFEDAPDFNTVTMVDSVEGSNVTIDDYAPIQQRAFSVSFKATFVQSSEVPAAQQP